MRREANLFEKIACFDNLYLAAKKSFSGKKEKPRVAPFYFNMEKELIVIETVLKEESYCPGNYHTFEIREPKVRKICSSAFRDRVIHHAICNVIEPILEDRFIFDTYACRKFKGTHKAVRRAQSFMRGAEEPFYFLKCDIKKYFPSIDHQILKRLLRKIFKDRRLLNLIDKIIDHPVPGDAPGKGLPIGNLTSQYFANLYLGELDHYLKERLQVKRYIRYMDDFIIFSNDKTFLHFVLDNVRGFLSQTLKLELKEKVTKIAPVSDGLPFLGFRIFKNMVRLQRNNLIRLQRKVKTREQEYLDGEISVEELTQSVGSMAAHAAHADSWLIRRSLFEQSLRLA